MYALLSNHIDALLLVSTPPASTCQWPSYRAYLKPFLSSPVKLTYSSASLWVSVNRHMMAGFFCYNKLCINNLCFFIWLVIIYFHRIVLKWRFPFFLQNILNPLILTVSWRQYYTRRVRSSPPKGTWGEIFIEKGRSKVRKSIVFSILKPIWWSMTGYA